MGTSFTACTRLGPRGPWDHRTALPAAGGLLGGLPGAGGLKATYRRPIRALARRIFDHELERRFGSLRRHDIVRAAPHLERQVDLGRRVAHATAAGARGLVSDARGGQAQPSPRQPQAHHTQLAAPGPHPSCHRGAKEQNPGGCAAARDGRRESASEYRVRRASLTAYAVYGTVSHPV